MKKLLLKKSSHSRSYSHSRNLFNAVIILVISILNLSSSQSYDNAKINCFIQHLKAKKLLPTNFDEAPSIRTIKQCDKIVDNVKNIYYEKIKSSSVLDLGTINFENSLEKERLCFDKEIKSREIGDYILKLIVYRSLGIVSFNFVVDQQKTRDLIMELIASSASNCTFNTIYETFNYERIKNYCKRKYVIDHNVLNMKEYNLTLNPFNVKIPEVNYEEVIAKIVSDNAAFIENRINSERSDDPESAKYKFKFNDDKEALNFLSKNWAVIFLTELNISPEEKEAKEKQYAQELFEFHKSKNIIPLDDQCCDYFQN